jgi:hypothetical protein
MDTAFETYVIEEEKIYGMGEAELQQAFPCDGPLHQVTADIAPLPPTIQDMAAEESETHLLPVLQLAATSGCGGCGTQAGGCCQ